MLNLGEVKINIIWSLYTLEILTVHRRRYVKRELQTSENIAINGGMNLVPYGSMKEEDRILDCKIRNHFMAELAFEVLSV